MGTNLTDAVHPLLRSAYRWRLLILLMLTNTLSFVDRAIMSVVVEPMRHDLGLSDAQIGILQGLAFAFIYALIGIPVGRLAERGNRPWIIGVAIIVFSAATGLCGFASSFLQLFLLRMMVGVSFFARVHHLPIAVAAATSGLISFFSLAPGMLIGGNLVDRISRLDERWYLWTPAIGAAVGSGFFLLGFYQMHVTIAVPLIIVGGILLFLHYAPCYALVQLIAGVRQRASAVAIYGVFLGLLGSGLGPTITGVVSTFVARRQFTLGNLAALCPGGRALQPGGVVDHACQAAAAAGMRAAMITGAALMLWGALHFLLGARTISKALAAGRV